MANFQRTWAKRKEKTPFVKRPEKTFDGKKTWQTPGRRESNEASGLITIYIPKKKRQKMDFHTHFDGDY
jgi:hypothetical protein